MHENVLKHLDHYIRGTVDYENVLWRRLDICIINEGVTTYPIASFTDDSTWKNTSDILMYDRYRGIIQRKLKKQS